MAMVVTPGRSIRGMPGNAINYDGPIDVIGNVQVIARAVESTVSKGRTVAR